MNLIDNFGIQMSNKIVCSTTKTNYIEITQYYIIIWVQKIRFYRAQNSFERSWMSEFDINESVKCQETLTSIISLLSLEGDLVLNQTQL